ncbi:MAG: glycohydrolase toxin TNT-related protein [Defluviicoccus sp.]|nr:glycohydrolase toxin TNT-related protein [Defluviicoccus sp.]
MGGYTSNLVSTGELSPLAKWSIDTAAAAAAAPLAGSSFEQVLAAKALGSLEAQGANWIGTQFLGEAGSVGHVIAHGALGALMAKLRDADPVAGALGGATEALLTPAAHQAIGPDASPELLDLVARLAAGLTAHAAGRDPLTAANAAGNAFENNYLKHREIDAKLQALDQCRGAANPGACAGELERHYTALSRANTDRLINCATTEACRAALAEVDTDRAQLQARRDDLERRLASLDAAERREYQLLNDNLDNALGGRVSLAATEERLLQRFASVVGPLDFTPQESERMLRAALMSGGGVASAAALARGRPSSNAPINAGALTQRATALNARLDRELAANPGTGTLSVANAGRVASETKLLAKFAANSATRIYRNLDLTINERGLLSQERNLAEAAGWQHPDGSIWWPPYDGAIPGSQRMVSLEPSSTGSINLIDRYGRTSGTFVSPAGLSLGSRALNYTPTFPPSLYSVDGSIDGVVRSTIAPWFGQKGLGVQYKLPNSVQYYLDTLKLGEAK